VIATELPELPSDLIEVAVHDLELCRADPRYEINMGAWHRPFDEVCHVCLAGSVLAKTFHADPHAFATPHYVIDGTLENVTYWQLHALDSLRHGKVGSFLREATMFRSWDWQHRMPKVPVELNLAYPGDRDLDRLTSWLRTVATTLKAHNL
jgi:hypothetical protein